MDYTHEKFGKCTLSELTQKQLEDYSKAMKDGYSDPMPVVRGNMVRAVVDLGLLVEPEWKPEDIDNANPGHIHWLSECVTKWIAEAINVDPLS